MTLAALLAAELSVKLVPPGGDFELATSPYRLLSGVSLYSAEILPLTALLMSLMGRDRLDARRRASS